jgi:hypothetical protein
MAEQFNMEQQLSQGIRLTTRSDTSTTTRAMTSKHKIRDNIIQEEPWNLTKMLERYSFIESLPWLSAQPSHLVLSKLRVPQDLIVNGLTSAPFDNFIYWNGTVKLKFQVIGSPLTQGCCVAFFVPLTDSSFIEANILPNFSSISVNQCVYMFANANTSAEMDIAFNSVQGYLDITDTSPASINNTLGYVYVVVFNQLALSTGTPDNVAISIFSQFTDNEFKVPRRTAVSRILSTRTQSNSRVLNGFMQALQPDNIVGDVIDLAAGIFGMDNPIDPGIEKTTKLITTQRMNFGEGIEFIDKLTVQPAKTSEVTSDTFATTQDEMDFDVIKKKYSYLGSFNMTTGNVSGDILASFPMNPCPNFVNYNPLQVPLIQYLSLPYCFWKGSLTYKIQVVSTSMQTAKIFVSLNYGEFAPSSPGILVSTSSQYGEAFEINQGSNTYEFTAPYVSITPEIYVPTTNVVSSVNSLGMINISVLNNLVSPNNSPTTITFNIFIAGGDDFSLNTLSAGNNLLPFRFNPGPALRQIRKKVIQEIEYDSDIEIIPMPSSRTVSRVRLQSAAQPLITPMSNINMSDDSLVAPPSQEAHRVDVAQKHITDLRKLMKKYHLFTHYTRDLIQVPSLNGNSIAFPLTQLFGFSAIAPTAFSPTGSPPIPALWAHYQSLFRQFKGSLNFKLMFDNTEDCMSQFSVFYQPPVENRQPMPNLGNQTYAPTPRLTYNVNSITPTTWQTNTTGTRLPVTYINGVNRTLEFSVPYSSRYLSVINNQATENTGPFDYSDLGTLVFYFDSIKPRIGETEKNIAYNVFFSFGDDARFGTLFNVPYLRYNPFVNPATGAIIGPAWPDLYEPTSPVNNTLILL